MFFLMKILFPAIRSLFMLSGWLDERRYRVEGEQLSKCEFYVYVYCVGVGDCVRKAAPAQLTMAFSREEQMVGTINKREEKKSK